MISFAAVVARRRDGRQPIPQPCESVGASLLGLLVGFLNISGEETHGFLLAAIGLMLSVTAVQDLPFVGEAATWILANVAVFIAPAVLVVALKTLFHAAKKV